MSPDKNLTNDEILSNAQSGKENDIEAVIEEYRTLVVAIASKPKYQDSPIEKDDLIQEGMIGLLAAYNSYNKSKGASFKTYASICIENSIQTALKKNFRQKDIPQSSLVELTEEELPEHSSILSAEDVYIAQESVSLLTELLRKNLSDFENEVLRLHIVGCSYNEIADRLCKTPKAIDNALQRVRKKIDELSPHNKNRQ